jgi:adenylate kinase family enzyme
MVCAEQQCTNHANPSLRSGAGVKGQANVRMALPRRKSKKIKIKFDEHSKILVVGTSGSGKSTLARNISAILQIKDIELDALFWKENWTQSRIEEFRIKIEKSIKDEKGYVLHGNYNQVNDLTWGNADTVIWLDYSRFIVMWRVIKRTIIRIITQEELWAGNKETIKNSFFDKDSIILWAWNTYSTRKAQYKEMVKENPYKIKTYIVFKRPREAKGFVKELKERRILTTVSTL